MLLKNKAPNWDQKHPGSTSASPLTLLSLSLRICSLGRTGLSRLSRVMQMNNVSEKQAMS